MLAGGGRGSSSDYEVVNGKFRHKTDNQKDKAIEEKRVRFLQSSVNDDFRDTDKRNNNVKAKQIFNQNSSIPILGINSPKNNNYQELCFDNSQLWGSQVDNKFKVIKVVENSQAATLGLKVGDKVLKINDVDFQNLEQWNNAKNVSQFTILKISRDQNIINHTTKTSDKDTYDSTFFNKGMFGIDLTQNLKICGIKSNSEAESNGLQVGHVITTVINSRTGDKFPVNDVNSYKKLVSSLKELGIPVTFRIKKEKNTLTRVNRDFILPSSDIESHIFIPGSNVVLSRPYFIVPGNSVFYLG